jgi:hypothetical protein
MQKALRLQQYKESNNANLGNLSNRNRTAPPLLASMPHYGRRGDGEPSERGSAKLGHPRRPDTPADANTRRGPWPARRLHLLRADQPVAEPPHPYLLSRAADAKEMGKDRNGPTVGSRRS